MKAIRHAIIGAVALSFASAIHSSAITNTAIAVSGTNIILSWPSYGYENYLVQYRQTLDPSDSWSALTNAYPANSTNRTTFTIYGILTPPSGGSSFSGGGGSPPSPNFASSSMMADTTATAATTAASMPMLVDKSGVAVPLAIYPPGFDLSGFTILDPATGETVSGAGYTVSALSPDVQPLDNPQPLDNNNSSTGPTTGFFRVFHIPTFRANFSGYTFTGPTFIPVDYASPDAPVDNVDSTTVLINGQPTDNSIFMPYVINGVTNWGMAIYFDRFPNGTNTIQLLTTVRQSDTLNDQTPYMVFSNAPAAINIGNSITFTNWSELILSNTYTFQAQSSLPNVNWEIDIYDAYDNFVNYQTGYSADGNISWTWNLMDYWGNNRQGDSDPFFFPYITVTQNSSSPAQSGGAQPNAGGSASSWMPPLANQYPDEGAWLFAHMDKFYDDGTSNYADADSYYTPAIQNLEGGPLLWGTVTYDAPIKYGKSYSQSDRNASWDSLRDDLRGWNARNFYYFGHGAANSFGGDFNKLDANNDIIASDFGTNTKAYITAQWVHDNVTYNKTWGAMPFRFIFLDGCNTAIGNWPWAWGVPKQSVNTDWYKNSANNPNGSRPNAFLGWDVTVGGKKENWGTIDKFWQFREFWMGQWSVSYTGKSLDDALDEARDASGWVPSQVNAHLKRYGYTAISFKQYNQAGNWP